MAEQQEGKPRRTAEQLKSLLVEAVRKGDLENFKESVNECRVDNGEREKLLNAAYNGGWTFLHIATEHNHLPIIKWILSEEGGRAAGFNKVLSTTGDGDTALLMAARRGVLENFLAIVDGLRVDNGERQKMLNAVDSNNHTILHRSIYGHPSIISWILSEEGGRTAGFNCVLSRTKDGATALHCAAWRGNLEVIHPIVNGCRVDNGERQEMLNAVDHVGMTVLHIAVDFNCEEIVSWILSDEGGRAAGFDSVLAKTTDDKRTALHFAAQYSSPDSAKTLLSHCTNGERMNLFLAVDKHGWTALHYASKFKKLEVIAHLLSYPECGLIVNMKDNRGMTALHRAIIGGLHQESRREWGWRFEPEERTIRALLGLNTDSSSSSTSTTTTAKAWIDPNIGLGL